MIEGTTIYRLAEQNDTCGTYILYRSGGRSGSGTDQDQRDLDSPVAASTVRSMGLERLDPELGGPVPRFSHHTPTRTMTEVGFITGLKIGHPFVGLLSI
jgi:hypothetical protein